VAGAAVSGREAILARVRAAARARGQAEREAVVAARLAAHEPGIVPLAAQAAGRGRLTLFLNKLEAASASVSRISDVAELPRAVARELRKRNLPAALRMGAEPLFDGLDWGTLETSRGPGRLEEPATLSRAAFGVAETGTLVLLSGPDNPVTLTFLGETHFVVLRESELMGSFEEMWAALRTTGRDPRTVNLVTGPSRSADIGQVLQLGAHGPIALHLFLVD
jgi:L-lactate dehydrogenase complex protein LldG